MDNRVGISDQTSLELLGGCKKCYKKESIDYYELQNNELVTMKFSHQYDGANPGYWFGITPSALAKYSIEKLTHVILIIGYEGILKLPISLLNTYLKNADVSTKTNGSVKHFHVRIKYDKDLVLFNKQAVFPIEQFLIYDEDIVLSEISSKSIDQIRREAEKFQDYQNQYRESKKNKKYRKESLRQKERIACLEQHTCQVCGFYYEYSKKGKKHWIITVDHIHDKAKGGGETIDNLWVLCPNCHAKKTAGIIEINKDKKTVREKGQLICIRDNHLGF